jgi:phosphocarrier protein FPr
MVEVPATALNHGPRSPRMSTSSASAHNDLTQYTLAAERGNPAVAHLADPMDPAMCV